jgi:hypothetical protein
MVGKREATMRLASWCFAVAAVVSLGLPQLQADEGKKDEKTEAKKDKEVKGKIPAELRKKIQENKVTHGVVIIEVTAGGASQMGREKPKGEGDVILLEEGDIITHVDGKEIKTADDYHKLISGKDEKKITVIDVNTGKSVTDYFKPNDGTLEIVFEVIAPSVG